MTEPHDFPASWLRVFTEVARLGSFTAAGRALGYTQSAVSRQISALEGEAGVPLFDRLARGVRLTEAGGTLLPHAEAVLGRLAAARRDLAALRDLTAGRVRVGGFATAQVSLLPRAVTAYRSRHPNVALRVEEGLTGRLVARLLAGHLDVAVVSTTGSAPFDGLDLVPLLTDHMVVALPACHPLAGRDAIGLAELADEEWLAGSARPADTLMSHCLRMGFRPRISLVVSDWLAKQGFVAQGLGITLVPSLAVAAVRPDLALVPLLPDQVPVRQVYAATCRDLHRTAATEEFLAVLRETAAAAAAQAARAPVGEPA
ncbi:LysR family transcriptional regulator [Streptomyces sp. HPF1205]|uniref:LysR family transcriptional regulator n=1 Tax=Streptomyces sp. HPF1205 TaxID=2873262 RepID=UPI001CED6F9F|nr:LysR family transcriptional regulator [Streptomyces sp. HPF1205]